MSLILIMFVKINSYFYEWYLGFKDFICFSQRYTLQGIDLDELDFSSDNEDDVSDEDDFSDEDDVSDDDRC